MPSKMQFIVLFLLLVVVVQVNAYGYGYGSGYYRPWPRWHHHHHWRHHHFFPRPYYGKRTGKNLVLMSSKITLFSILQIILEFRTLIWIGLWFIFALKVGSNEFFRWLLQLRMRMSYIRIC